MMRILTPPCQGPCQGSTVFKLLRCQWLPLQQMCQQLSLPSWVTLSSIFLLKKQSQNNLIRHKIIMIMNNSEFKDYLHHLFFRTWSGTPPSRYTSPNHQRSKRWIWILISFVSQNDLFLHLTFEIFYLSFATCLYTGLCFAQLTDASDNLYWNLQWFCDYLHGLW